MKGEGLGRNSGKYLTSPLVSRLNEKLFDYCDEILDVRDKVYEIYEVLQKYENTEKHRRYCSRIIKAVDSPITAMRFTIAREQNVLLWPKDQRVVEKMRKLDEFKLI